MTAVASLVVDASGEEARSAAMWLAGFYPQVSVRANDGFVELQSNSLDVHALRSIWTAALVNELSFDRARTGRAAAFADLAR